MEPPSPLWRRRERKRVNGDVFLIFFNAVVIDIGPLQTSCICALIHLHLFRQAPTFIALFNVLFIRLLKCVPKRCVLQNALSKFNIYVLLLKKCISSFHWNERHVNSFCLLLIIKHLTLLPYQLPVYAMHLRCIKFVQVNNINECMKG